MYLAFSTVPGLFSILGMKGSLRALSIYYYCPITTEDCLCSKDQNYQIIFNVYYQFLFQIDTVHLCVNLLGIVNKLKCLCVYVSEFCFMLMFDAILNET